MTLKQLHFLLAVLEAKSFTKAAGILHVAQPAIGVQIAALEDELGVKLLVRHSRGVVPTEAGKRLARDAERLLGEAERARLGIMDMGRKPHGRVALGLTETARHALADRLVRSCRRDYPDLTLTLADGLSHGLADRLARGRIDMAVTYDPPANSGAVSEALAVEPLYFVAPPGHPLAAGPDITLRAALGADLILPAEPSMVRRRMAEAARVTRTDLRCVCDAESDSAIADLARLGVACAILPFGVVREHVEAGRLAALRIVDPELARTLYLTCSESRLGTKALEAVRDRIRALAAERIAQGATGWTLAASS